MEPDPVSLVHPGEVAADGYWGLDLEVSNTADTGTVADVIAARYAKFREQLVASQSRW